MLMTVQSAIVPISYLYLDPNNYRFIDLEDYVRVDEENLLDASIQARTLQFVCGKSNEGIQDLLVSFKTNGFLKLEPIQVRKIKENAYLVLEGNRRVSTLKTLYNISLHNGDVGSLSPEVFEHVEVSVIADDEMEQQLITMGLHHISGKKRWNPLNQCQLVVDLRDKYHMSADDICRALGLSKQFVNRCFRTIALINEYKHSDYGDQFQTNMYSFFEETLKSPKMRTWLAWNDWETRCVNVENRDRLFSWFSKVESNEGEDQDFQDYETLEPIITKSVEIRSLSEFIDDETALQRMEKTRDFYEGYHSSEVIAARRTHDSIAALEHEMTMLGSGSSYLSTSDENKIRSLGNKIQQLLSARTNVKVATSSVSYLDVDGNLFSRIDVKKYRGLENVVLDGLTRYNLFVGDNNAGKTMLLEAIYALIQMNDMSSLLELERFRSKLPANTPTDYLIRNLSDKYSIEGVFGDTKFTSMTYQQEDDSVTMDKTGYLSTLYNDSAADEDTYTMKMLMFDNKAAELYYNKIMHVCPAAFTSPYRADREKLVDAHRRVVELGEMDSLVTFIRENFDATINSIRLTDTIMGGRFIVNSSRFEKGLDLTKYGEGLIRVFEISLYVIASTHGCVFIDEIDSGIHKDVLRPFVEFLLKLADKYGVQLFMTTHSKEFVDTLSAVDGSPKVTAFQMRRDTNGALQIMRASGNKLNTLINQFNLDIR